MRIRMFAEVEVSDDALIKQFGEELVNITASHALESSLARQTERFLKQNPHTVEAKVIFLPKMI